MTEGHGAAPMRCGTVALLGAPNAGKSTLLNRLVGAKVSIVTPKAQTTRAPHRGIVARGRSQLVFVDMPGVFAPRRSLDRAMVGAAWSGARDADAVVVLIDARRPPDAVRDDTAGILERLRRERRAAILALNKIDLVARPKLLALAAAVAGEGPDAARVFMISALTGDGVADLTAHLAAVAPVGPWLYPADQVADVAPRTLAAEVAREKLFLALHKELPYALTVETAAWDERRDGSVRIDLDVLVARRAHKPIVLGGRGARLREVGAAARAELEALFARRVHLFLRVRVREGWADEPARYAAMGLEFPTR